MAVRIFAFPCRRFHISMDITLKNYEYTWYDQHGGRTMELNKVQTAAFELIQSDARFLYTISDMMQNAKNINSNYIMMCQPYIGIFTDGAEQWCKKVGLNAPTFNDAEKAYYTALRQGHKLLEKTYDDYSSLLMKHLIESDNYFYHIRSLREKIFGYYNVGTDICNGEFCGNTIICAAYMPIATLGNRNVGVTIRDMSIIVGKLSAFLGCTNFPHYRYDDNNIVTYKDYHFYNNCPLKIKNIFGFILFSVLCSINYATVFVDTYFTEEIPQKFKFAYLQYYYLCDFIKELNIRNNTQFHIDDSLKNREFRNCLAHYGLGQLLSENDIVEHDILKGLTNKVFDKDYLSTKQLLYKYLNDLSNQIKKAILINC